MGNRNDCAQDEDDGPGDILDDELQRQLNEMADYDSANEEDPVIAGHSAGVASLHLLVIVLTGMLKAAKWYQHAGQSN